MVRRKRVTRRALGGEQARTKLIKIDAAFDYYVSTKKGEGLRPRTIHDYNKTWRYFTGWLNEKRYDAEYLSDITPEICRRYITYLTEDAPRYKGHTTIDSTEQGVGLAPATINIRIRCLKAFFGFFFREGYLESSPMENIRQQKTDMDAIESFTDEQINALINACDQRTYVGFRDYVYQVLLLDSGLRQSEALSLTEADVDVKTRCVNLAAKFNKNRKPRIVPISQTTVRLLFELIQENSALFDKQATQGCIFLSSYGTPLTSTQANKRLKYYGDITGVGEEIRTTAHTWRHTAARKMVLNGMDVYTLARILGHSSINMTRRYIQITSDDMRDQHDKFSPVALLSRRVR